MKTIHLQINHVATILTGLGKETSAGRKYDVKQETENLSQSPRTHHPRLIFSLLN
jgi:hypothetical protein